MAENVGDDKSDLESVTSSQKSFLKNCPFADPRALSTKSTDSDSTEVIRNQISPAVVQTPILSFSSPTSLDSINDDVFRTPPENASLSSAADSEPKVWVSEIKPRRGASKLKSLSSTPNTTPVSENVRVSEIKPRREASNLKSLSSTPKTTPVSENVRVLEIKLRGGASKLKSLSSTPGSENVRVLETNHPSDSGVLMPLSSPPSVRVPGKQPDSDSSSPTAIERALDLEKKPFSASVANTEVMKSPDKVIKTRKVNSGRPLPFKQIIEAILRNSGKNLKEKDENVSCVEILKQCGLKFP